VHAEAACGVSAAAAAGARRATHRYEPKAKTLPPAACAEASLKPRAMLAR